MSIAFIPYNAAFDTRLDVACCRLLLLYLAGRDVHANGWWHEWCWESARKIARTLSVPGRLIESRDIEQARSRLCECGYLEQADAIITEHYTRGGKDYVRRVCRRCYRVAVTLN